MTERPILFSGPMVRAILDGSKTQTRRPMRPQPVGAVSITHTATVKATGCKTFTLRGDDGAPVYGLPKGRHAVTADVVAPWAVGDRLWVRETWRTAEVFDGDSPARIAKKCIEAGYPRPWAPTYYEASAVTDNWESSFGVASCKQRPSIHMPRWASRITLEVTDVRVERVQDISDADAVAEGCGVATFPVSAFSTLWERTYGVGSWARNGWVWATSFRHIDAKGGAA